MRAEGGSRKGKIEKTRLAGIVMMLAGILSITFAVAGVSGAGTTAALPAHHQCQDGGQYSSTTGSLAGAIDKGCNQTTTTTMHKCDCTTTTTMPVSTTTKPCNTTTSTAATTTSMAPTTTTEAPTTTSTEVAGETTTTVMATTTSMAVSGETTTTVVIPPPINNVQTTTSLQVEGITTGLPGITVEPASTGTLPFTGGSPIPLVVTGVVLLATGAGLSRKRRSL